MRLLSREISAPSVIILNWQTVVVSTKQQTGDSMYRTDNTRIYDLLKSQFKVNLHEKYSFTDLDLIVIFSYWKDEHEFHISLILMFKYVKKNMYFQNFLDRSSIWWPLINILRVRSQQWRTSIILMLIFVSLTFSFKTFKIVKYDDAEFHLDCCKNLLRILWIFWSTVTNLQFCIEMIPVIPRIYIQVAPFRISFVPSACLTVPVIVNTVGPAVAQILIFLMSSITCL